MHAMMLNLKEAMQPPYIVNLPPSFVAHPWYKFGTKDQSFPKYFKLFKLTTIMMKGFVKDELVFTMENFLNTKSNTNS